MNQINKTNFKGQLILGQYLSKNFEKSVPVLSEMIKDKPYDVFVRAHVEYKTKNRIQRITRFHAKSYTYLGNIDHLDKFAKTTKEKSYKNALQNLINDMDAKIKKHEELKKNLTRKEKFIEMLEKYFFSR